MNEVKSQSRAFEFHSSLGTIVDSVKDFSLQSPYVNSISAQDEPDYPGDSELEQRIENYIRWNAMAMVVQANRGDLGLGGHISTFASCATLYEVGQHHFFRGNNHPEGMDALYFQGHASPGNYARAFLEYRLDEAGLRQFRREAAARKGLSSYPHPMLMPEFWQFPTVSMGLSPLMSIYQARFNQYLNARQILSNTGGRVWCFLGDGETDEPESLAAIRLAGREKLGSLIWVVNCNLQRLDGPVRGSGKLIQELERSFRAGGWKVIKVLWSSEWDSLLRRDFDGVLKKRMEEVCDGEYQKYVVSPGSYMRSHFFGKYPELTKLVEGMSDEELCNLKRGGHDQAKVYAAYSEAVQETDAPTVILAKTIKGFGLGEAGAASNTTHQQKQLDEKELRAFRDRFEIPVTDRQIADTPFYRPSKESPEIQYLLEKREQLGGLVPARTVRKSKDLTCSHSHFEDFYSGSDGNPVSTTSAFVHLLGKLLQDNDVGNRIVPIIPDEARTFGLDALFSKVGIYSPEGQLYEPVDSEHLLYYREEKDGQILEEGITEAGAMASFIAAGTSYATHAEPVIPFYLFYSMFGFQRVGDLIWAALDSRVKGFLLGATAGRTTLNGEGLQHQDGHSHAIASTFPGIKAYDPAFAYETSTIVEAGLKEICASGDENILYYLTLYNEQYPMPERPDGVREGIIKGMYLLSECQEMTCKGHILASGPIIQEALRAQQRLAEDFQVGASVWSVTSFSELRKDALAKERYNLFHPGDDPKKSYLERSLEGTSGVFIAATDYVRLVPDQIARWIPGSLYSLGTDGFGRSDTRKALRRFFEIDAESIVLAFLSELRATEGMDSDTLQEAFYKLEMDPAKRYPEAI